MGVEPQIVGGSGPAAGCIGGAVAPAIEGKAGAIERSAARSARPRPPHGAAERALLCPRPDLKQQWLAMTGRFHHDLSELVSIHEPLVAAICAGKAQRAFDLAIRHNEPDGRKLAQSVADGFPPGLRGAGGRQAFPR